MTTRTNRHRTMLHDTALYWIHWHSQEFVMAAKANPNPYLGIFAEEKIICFLFLILFCSMYSKLGTT